MSCQPWKPPLKGSQMIRQAIKMNNTVKNIVSINMIMSDNTFK